MHRAETVREPRDSHAWEDKVRCRGLPDVAKSLREPIVQDGALDAGDRNVPVDRVPDLAASNHDGFRRTRGGDRRWGFTGWDDLGHTRARTYVRI